MLKSNSTTTTATLLLTKVSVLVCEYDVEKIKKKKKKTTKIQSNLTQISKCSYFISSHTHIHSTTMSAEIVYLNAMNKYAQETQLN